MSTRRICITENFFTQKIRTGASVRARPPPCTASSTAGRVGAVVASADGASTESEVANFLLMYVVLAAFYRLVCFCGLGVLC